MALAFLLLSILVICVFIALQDRKHRQSYDYDKETEP
jgi:hypothetical protein